MSEQTQGPGEDNRVRAALSALKTEVASLRTPIKQVVMDLGRANIHVPGMPLIPSAAVDCLADQIAQTDDLAVATAAAVQMITVFRLGISRNRTAPFMRQIVSDMLGRLAGRIAVPTVIVTMPRDLVPDAATIDDLMRSLTMIGINSFEFTEDGISHLWMSEGGPSVMLMVAADDMSPALRGSWRKARASLQADPDRKSVTFGATAYTKIPGSGLIVARMVN